MKVKISISLDTIDHDVEVVLEEKLLASIDVFSHRDFEFIENSLLHVIPQMSEALDYINSKGETL